MALKRPFTKRKLIDSKEEQVSFVQIIGFVLIAIGILYLLFKLFWHFNCSLIPFTPIHGDKLSIAFFIIMLGVAFAFPDLLSDNTGGLSTMRIVVFMVVNVICILLLDIGWGKHSFTEIGIDSYWMGIIAFVFGAKATQSFFESKMATIPNIQNNINSNQCPESSDLKQTQVSIKSGQPKNSPEHIQDFKSKKTS